MVFCFIALGVFGILGIFSAKYRVYFKEALKCVMQTAILRPCTTGFDKRMQVKISTRLARKNKKIGNFFYKNFQAISIVFVILMFGSLAFGLWGLYNFFAFGNCNGPQGGECILNDLTYSSQECIQAGIINDLNNNLESITISKANG